MVVLWHMKLVTNQVFDIVQPAPDNQQVHTEITALSVEFDINDQLMQDPGSIVVSYGYSSNFQEGPPGEVIVTEVASPGLASFASPPTGTRLEPPPPPPPPSAVPPAPPP